MRNTIKQSIFTAMIAVVLCTQTTYAQWSLTGNAGTSASTNFIGTTDNVALKIRTKNVVRVTITGSGNVGIGTTSPSNKLSVTGNANFTGNVGIGTSTPTRKLDVVGGEVACLNSGYGFTHTDGTTTLETYVDGNGGWFGTQSNHNLYFITNDAAGPQMTLTTSGNVGIGTSSPHGLLQFSNANGNRKIILYEDADNDHQYIGLGVNGNNFRYQVDGTIGSHIFYAGTSASASNELMRITGSGNVGIGTSAPTTAKLVIAGGSGLQGLDLSTSDQYANMRVLQNTNSSTDKDMYIGYQSGATSSLHLYSNNSETMTLKGSKVGINQSDPHAQLHLGNQLANRRIILWEAANNDHQFAGFGMNNNILRYQVEGTSGNHIFYAATSATASNELMRIQGDGRVSIGSPTAATGYQLTVGGKIICTELKVQVQPFPDYVFADNYNLKTIDEVEQHIKTYNRLPGMPSASEVEENGMNVGDMQTKVVEKVEENTLYIIQLSKENKELKEQLKSIQLQLDLMKK
ncbi:MAG: hypothetical protein ABI723_22045 [Bacteroidia bacterium]